MMRSHGTNTPREIWNFGKKGDWAYDAIDKYINLRYSLLPYIYSASWDVTANGSSMMRALVMDFDDDKNVLDIDNQFMFGKSLLVAPVTEPMYVKYRKNGNKYVEAKEDFSTMKSTEVYLPAGTKWFDFWTGQHFEGGQKVSKVTPVDVMPLYVKAGTILPMGPKAQYANQKIGPLVVRVYPGANGEFTFYDDQRDNYTYENGAFATINFKWDDAMQTLTIGKQEGSYEGMPVTRQITLVKVSETNGTGLPFDEKATVLITYKGDKIEIEL